ncbi:MAG TPA: bifunctional 4-hydroxy-2-oxoglutarate aldolase/2-dehydro-3-deoxy-phosphogluconate aldolase [Vicinamibacterales bacterium]|nr:bifunctional 4-hydroxy-2-oxoglutarate aldolase/2-dehydro-3-deoxy-phosphogluconate aldolase [Vicinamibacterales bacterium]
MTRQSIAERIIEIGILPVVRAASGAEAIAVGDALGEGGIRALEITMTVPGAVRVIAEAVARYGDQFLIGAGTVLDEEQARACIDAGARFVVAPIVDVATIAVCRRADIPVLPGALTPTEVVQAWRAGADFVKVFPCSAVGGASYLRALKAPLPHIPLVPTGGVTLETVGAFFAAGASAVGVGGDLCDLQAIRAGRRDKLVAAARAYVSAVQAARSAVL